MPLKKRYLKTKPVCKVTFIIPKELADGHKSAYLVGEFNDWDTKSNPMKYNKKEGTFTLILDLEKGREYQFRYLLNSEFWVNESGADRHVPTPFGIAENSVLIL